MFNAIIGCVIGIFLVMKPTLVMEVLGKIYLKMSNLTALEQNEENKKYFFGGNPIWLRILGLMWFSLGAYSIYLRLLA